MGLPSRLVYQAGGYENSSLVGLLNSHSGMSILNLMMTQIWIGMNMAKLWMHRFASLVRRIWKIIMVNSRFEMIQHSHSQNRLHPLINYREFDTNNNFCNNRIHTNTSLYCAS